MIKLYSTKLCLINVNWLQFGRWFQKHETIIWSSIMNMIHGLKPSNSVASREFTSWRSKASYIGLKRLLWLVLSNIFRWVNQYRQKVCFCVGYISPDLTPILFYWHGNWSAGAPRDSLIFGFVKRIEQRIFHEICITSCHLAKEGNF